MKFVISSSTLSSRLQIVGRVIAPKNNLPILDSFLFDIRDNKLTLTASDNETTLTTVVDLVESDADIRFAVNAKTVQDAIKEIPEQPLDFFVNPNTMEITVEYQNGKYNFMGQAADEYPLPPAMEDDNVSLCLTSSVLLNSINRALFATADDALRPVMNGIYFDASDENLAVVASDGHKLACGRVYGAKASRPGTFILPKKPAGLLRNILAKEQGEAVIRFTDRNAVVSTENYVVSCRLIEGRYPNYNSVIPQNNPNCVTVNRGALLSALRRVLIFSSATSALIKIQLAASKMTISSQDIDFSMSAEESLLCDYSGMPMSIGFKGTFLTELLNNLEGEEVVMQLSDASRAGVMVPAQQQEGEHVLMLLMPMMLND
ncbi:MAG: DNA polymerase III subunit beta [Bacteroidaceae bacterium]|nr:DNA polymerase III subunit beta [Bacteroidaceae bacterium]